MYSANIERSTEMWSVGSNLILLVFFVLFAHVNAADVDSQGLRRQYLDEHQWKLCDEYLQCVPARVPGNILLDTNRSANPLEGFNELEWASQSLKTWIYNLNLTNFHGWADDESAQLRFEGIDTVASVKCNGKLLQSTTGETIIRNAWISHTFPLPKSCNANRSLHIEVIIYPALNETQRLKQEVFNDRFYPHTVNYNVWSEPTYRNLLRKPASDFGWDWGPSFPGGGLTGRVSLEIGLQGHAYVDPDISVIQKFDDRHQNVVRVRIGVRVNRLPGGHISHGVQQLCVDLEETNQSCKWLLPWVNLIHFDFILVNPRLWYPLGSRNYRFPANLYSVVINLSGNNPVKTYIGIRKVKHIRKKGEFYFEINDELIDWRGMNLIPFEVFSSNENPQKIATELPNWVKLLNINSFRIWGGGRFPVDTFYETCDRLGVLVWQDLPWACAVFPATQEFLQQAKIETTELLLKYNHHPSIVVWGGNNEVEASFAWFEETRGPNMQRYRQDYIQLFMKTIPLVVRDVLGNEAIYLDSSPSNGLNPDGTKRWGDANDPSEGDIHFYDYNMDCEDFEGYPKARFVSEHGVQSLPLILPRFVGKEKLKRVLKNRQRHEFGFDQLDRQAERMFGRSLEGKLSKLPYIERALVSHMMQGRCLSTAISAWRSYPRNHGVLLWQLNDVWPGVSWSVLEHNLMPKASAYAVRKAFRPARLSLRRVNEASPVVNVYIQITHETRVRSRLVRGFTTAIPFEWDRILSETHNIVFSFHFDPDASEQLIGSLPAQSGWRLKGLLYIDMETTTEIHLLDEWIEPETKFTNLVSLESCADARIRVSVVDDVIQLRASSLVVPYVLLHFEGDYMSHLEDNGIFLLPHEEKNISVTCRIPPCDRNLELLRVTNLRQTLCENRSKPPK